MVFFEKEKNLDLVVERRNLDANFNTPSKDLSSTTIPEILVGGDKEPEKVIEIEKMFDLEEVATLYRGKVISAPIGSLKPYVGIFNDGDTELMSELEVKKCRVSLKDVSFIAGLSELEELKPVLEQRPKVIIPTSFKSLMSSRVQEHTLFNFSLRVCRPRFRD